MMRKARGTTVWMAALVLLSGCGGATRFVHPDADLPFYEKVAVVPFQSLAQDRAAGEKITNVFFAELLNRKFDQVVEPGQFAAAMTRVRGGTPYSNPWSGEDLGKLAEDTGVQGLFMGTIREYSMTQNGRDLYPMVALEVRFVDAASGRIVWSSSLLRKGGPGVPFLSRGARTLDGLAAEACREILGTLPEVKTHGKPAS